MNRCPECRTRRATLLSLLSHVAASGHRVCTCGGYPWPHRKFSTYCYENPMSEVHVAQRAGAERADLLEIEADCAWEKAGRPLRSWV